MIEYHKINTIFKRDEKTHKIILGEYSQPEFAYLSENQWEWTEKLNGTNVRIEWGCLTQTIKFGGKTDNSQIPVKLLYALQELFTIEKMSFLYPETSMTLFAEGCGKTIQSDSGNTNELGIVLFDVLIGNWWLERHNVNDIANKLGIKYAPIIGCGILSQAIDFVHNKQISTFGNFPMEGIVLRPTVELFARNGSRIIAKLKHRDFL